MAYTFTKETAATFKITGGSSSGLQDTISLKGVSSQVQNADTVIAAINGLLYLANRAGDYNYENAVRVVNEDVDYDE